MSHVWYPKFCFLFIETLLRLCILVINRASRNTKNEMIEPWNNLKSPTICGGKESYLQSNLYLNVQFKCEMVKFENF